MRTSLTLVSALTITLLSSSAMVQTIPTPIQQLEKLFISPDKNQFDSSSLKKLSYSELVFLFSNLVKQYGKFQRVEPLSNTEFRMWFETDTIKFIAQFNNKGQFTQLSFELDSDATTLKDSQIALKKLWMNPNDSDIFSIKADTDYVAQAKEDAAYLKENYGNIVELRKSNNDHYILNLEKRGYVTYVRLDYQNKILSFIPIVNPENDILDNLKEFSGKSQFLVTENGKILFNQNEKIPMGVSDSFNLAVLAATQKAVKDGKLKWETLISIKAEDFTSLSPNMNTKKIGEKVTVGDLANIMIRDSDHTATDILIRIVGRENVEKFVPKRNLPLLTNKNVFELRSKNNSNFLEKYRKSNLQQKRAILNKIDLSIGTIINFKQPANPNILDLEWYFTTSELCNLMKQVKDSPSMRFEFGPINKDDWQQVSFKNGKEAGILNLTTYLKSRKGNTYCVSLTLNNPNDRFLNYEYETYYERFILSLLIRN